MVLKPRKWINKRINKFTAKNINESLWGGKKKRIRKKKENILNKIKERLKRNKV